MDFLLFLSIYEFAFEGERDTLLLQIGLSFSGLCSQDVDSFPLLVKLFLPDSQLVGGSFAQHLHLLQFCFFLGKFRFLLLQLCLLSLNVGFFFAED